MPKVETPSPDWEKPIKAVLAALLLLEADALRILRKKAKAKSIQSVAYIKTLDPSSFSFYREIDKSVKELKSNVEDEIVDIRTRARNLAKVQFIAQLALVRSLLGIRPPSHIQSNRSEDKVSGSLVGTSVSSAWGSMVLAEAETSVISKNIDNRIKRIVSTETYRAYNNEFDQYCEQTAKIISPTGLSLSVYKRWDATLDPKTCNICSGLDGQIVKPDESFSSGYLPGYVHPNCRCVSTLVTQ